MIKTAVQLLLMACILASCTQENQLSAQNPAPPPLQQAEMIVSDDYNHPPDDSAAWTHVDLPDNWNVSRPDQGGGVWYRIPIELSENAMQSMGVLLANYSMNASIWWDGVQLASGGQMSEPVTRNWHNPLYASIGKMQLQQGHHWLHIYIYGYANDAAGLGGAYIGPETSLLPIYRSIHFSQYTLSVIALFVMLMLAVGALLMWLLRPSQTIFAWLFIAALLWAVVISEFISITPTFSRFYWEAIAHSAIDFYILVLLIIVYRILDLHKPVVAWIILLVLLTGWLIILLFGGDADLMPWAMPLHSLAVIIGIYLCGLCMASWLRHHDKVALIVGAAITPQLIFSIHDWWSVYFGNQLDNVLIMQFGPSLTLLILGGWLIHSFAKVLKEAENHTVQIEAEAARVTASLKLEQLQTAQLQKKQLISVERERFTRELHDGLGGYLAAMSAMLHDGVQDTQLLTRTVDQALLDMRLVMDGVGEECNDVDMLMGMLRHRLQQPLQAWGLQVSWNLTGLPMHCRLNDGDGIHLMRIIQEALTNAARHAHADWVEVRASLIKPQQDQARVCIEVVDNGCGWSDMPEQGNGLGNMQKRAEMMQATLTMSSEPNAGVRIHLIVPVNITG